MAKSFKNQFRQLEKDINKEMGKVVKNTNRKLAKNPIKLPVSSDIPEDGVTVQHIDNSVLIEGNVSNSQIGGTGHFQVNIAADDVKAVLEDIKKISMVMDSADRDQLVLILEELQSNGNIKSKESKAFLERNPLISMGIGAIVEWTTSAGLDNLVGIIQSVFS